MMLVSLLLLLLLAAPAHAATTANMWVVASGAGSCTRSASLITFAAASAAPSKTCGSLNAAYAIAQAGDLILWKGGTYGSQSINDRGNIGGVVTFQTAEGETVSIPSGSLSNAARDIFIHGGDLPNVEETNRIILVQNGQTGTGECNSTMNLGQGNRNVIFEDVTCSSFFATAWQTTLRFSDIGPHDICLDQSQEDLVMLWPIGFPTTIPNMNSTIEYNRLFGVDERLCPGRAESRHSDNLVITGSNHVVRGNRIWWCATQCIFFSEFGGEPTNNLIENNMIGNTASSLCAVCGIALVGNTTDTTIRNNTIEGQLNFDSSPTITWVGNLFLSVQPNCWPGTYQYNVYPVSGGVTCGTNATRGTPKLASGNNYTYTGLDSADFHLHATDTAAAGKGNPANFPTLDLDKETRVSPPWAGADDASGSPPPPAPNAPTNLRITGLF